MVRVRVKVHRRVLKYIKQQAKIDGGRPMTVVAAIDRLLDNALRAAGVSSAPTKATSGDT